MLTLTEAREWCADHPECRGFTFSAQGECPQSDSIQLHIIFKTKADWIPGDGWHTFTVDDQKQAPAELGWAQRGEGGRGAALLRLVTQAAEADKGSDASQEDTQEQLAAWMAKVL
jgi:hypothetical protein